MQTTKDRQRDSEEKKYNLKIERILRRIGKRYRSLLDSQLIGVAVSDGDEHIYRINDKFLRIIGYTRADFSAGKIRWSAITPMKYDRLDKIKFDELKAFSVTDLFEKEYIHKNGQSVPVVVGAELICHEPPINISLVLDVSQQKKSEKEKEEMIAIIGHEIKTPLSVLRVQAELLYREAKSGISQAKLLKALKEFDQHITQMDHILSEIITFNKVRNHVTAAKQADFDVGVVLRQAVADIKLLSNRKIIINRAERDCIVCGNETEIREVIMNLISNALRYSPSETPVRVSVWQEGTTVMISVKDKGRGISKSDQRKIFLKSYQARSPENEEVQTDPLASSSRGLGLYLCRNIMKRHGGKIEVTSELGEGSTFTCTLPAGLCPII